MKVEAVDMAELSNIPPEKEKRAAPWQLLLWLVIVLGLMYFGGHNLNNRTFHSWDACPEGFNHDEQGMCHLSLDSDRKKYGDRLP